VVLVLDGSAGLATALPEVAGALEAIPAALDLAVVLAGEEPVVIEAPRSAGEGRTALRRVVGDLRTAGGCDNVPALVRGWELAAEKPDGILVWIHAAQPVLLSSPEALAQAYARRPRGPRLLVFQTVPGPNRVLEQLDGIPAIQTAARRGTVGEDLRRLFTSFTAVDAKNPGLTVRLEHGDGPPPSGPDVREVGLHLARLWAAEEVRRLHAARQPAAAVKLAGDYQLVTPWSGAVVLETQAQYDRHGLQPVDAATVPAIPEPSPRALLLLGCLVLLLRRRRAGPPGARPTAAPENGAAVPGPGP
jgi:hypothetical protein